MKAPRDHAIVVCTYPPDYPDLFQCYRPEQRLILDKDVRLGLVLIDPLSLHECLLALGLFFMLRPSLATDTA